MRAVRPRAGATVPTAVQKTSCNQGTQVQGMATDQSTKMATPIVTPRIGYPTSRVPDCGRHDTESTGTCGELVPNSRPVAGLVPDLIQSVALDSGSEQELLY
jgi:hypothetical protein